MIRRLLLFYFLSHSPASIQWLFDSFFETFCLFIFLSTDEAANKIRLPRNRWRCVIVSSSPSAKFGLGLLCALYQYRVCIAENWEIFAALDTENRDEVAVSRGAKLNLPLSLEFNSVDAASVASCLVFVCGLGILSRLSLRVSGSFWPRQCWCADWCSYVCI